MAKQISWIQTTKAKIDRGGLSGRQFIFCAPSEQYMAHWYKVALDEFGNPRTVRTAADARIYYGGCTIIFRAFYSMYDADMLAGQEFADAYVAAQLPLKMRERILTRVR